jgi:hypothetical protein
VKRNLSRITHFALRIQPLKQAATLGNGNTVGQVGEKNGQIENENGLQNLIVGRVPSVDNCSFNGRNALWGIHS